jgi:hypothetical protein
MSDDDEVGSSFERYAAALLAAMRPRCDRDATAIAGMYAVPGLIVVPGSVIPISGERQTEEFGSWF